MGGGISRVRPENKHPRQQVQDTADKSAFEELDTETRVQMAEDRKDEGNLLFSKGIR